MGPLELMYSWQALLCAAAAFGVTQITKRIIEVIYEKKLVESERQKIRKKAKEQGVYRSTPKDKQPSDGELKRKVNPVLNRIVLPIVPVIVGIVYAMVVPLRPETLIEYADTHLSGAWLYLGYGGWGAACGQFSTMLFDKLKDILQQANASTA